MKRSPYLTCWCSRHCRVEDIHRYLGRYGTNGVKVRTECGNYQTIVVSDRTREYMAEFFKVKLGEQA